MTDIPTGGVKRYGVQIVGEAIEWGYVGENGELKVQEFHPRVGIGFAEIIEFASMRADQTKSVNDDARAMRTELQAIADMKGEKELAEGEVDEELDDAKAKAYEAIIAKYQALEQDRFGRQIDLVLYLIDPNDREAMLPLFKAAHPTDVNELLEDLRQKVIIKTAKTAEAVMQVDPS